MSEKSKNIPLLGILPDVTPEEKKAYLSLLAEVIEVRTEYARQHSDAPETAVSEWQRTHEWLSGEKIALEFILRGIERLSRVFGITREQFVRRWAVIDKKAAGYCAQKALIKVAAILAIIGGATEADKPAKCASLADAHVNNAFRDFINAYLLSRSQKDERGHFQKATCTVKAQDLKEAISFKVLCDNSEYLTDKTLSDRIDAAIADGMPDFHSSTANTQMPQIKTLLTSLGVAMIVLPDGTRQERAYMARGQIIDVLPRFAALLLAIDGTSYQWKRMNSTRA